MSNDNFEYADRDYIYTLDLDFDVDSQLEAIHWLLQRIEEADQSLRNEIQQSDERARKLKGILNEFAVDDHISLLHASVYQDAAHSMAAVGMLAPLIETIFTQCFQGIGDKWPNDCTLTKSCDRFKAAHSIRWDCHNFLKNGRSQTDIVPGILQLAEAIGLSIRLPTDIDKTLRALFGYRNKIFHYGLEWPVKERSAFKKRIENDNWPTTWFTQAASDDRPWIFYLSKEFIKHCLEMIDKILTAFGQFIRDELPKIQRK